MGLAGVHSAGHVRRSKAGRAQGLECVGSYRDVFQCLVLSLGSSFLPAFGFVTGCISCKQTQYTLPAVLEELLSQ